jgi:hypothetical protein
LRWKYRALVSLLFTASGAPPITMLDNEQRPDRRTMSNERHHSRERQAMAHCVTHVLLATWLAVGTVYQ